MEIDAKACCFFIRVSKNIFIYLMTFVFYISIISFFLSARCMMKVVHLTSYFTHGIIEEKRTTRCLNGFVYWSGKKSHGRISQFGCFDRRTFWPCSRWQVQYIFSRPHHGKGNICKNGIYIWDFSFFDLTKWVNTSDVIFRITEQII